MIIKDENDIIGLKASGAIAARILSTLKKATVPGITTLELDLMAKQILEETGATSAPKVSYNFPGHVCISVNEEVAHGIPSGKIIMPGDVVNIDVSVEYNGYWTDMGETFGIPPIKMATKKLISATKQAFRMAIANIRDGASLNVVGRAYYKAAGKFNVIHNLTSHGTGDKLHSDPSHILSYVDPKEERIFKEGMVITIEPFLTTKGNEVINFNEWVLINPNKDAITAQYEHTLVVTKTHPIILTNYNNN